MQPYRQRVVDEKLELDGRVSRLEVFLRDPSQIDPVELLLLRCQLETMRAYSCVLLARIASWKP
jgi:hypothetical protein